MSLPDWQWVFSKALFIPAGPQQVTAIPQAFPCKFRLQSSVLGGFIVSCTYRLDDSKQFTAYAFGIHMRNFSNFFYWVKRAFAGGQVQGLPVWVKNSFGTVSVCLSRGSHEVGQELSKWETLGATFGKVCSIALHLCIKTLTLTPIESWLERNCQWGRHGESLTAW